MIRIYIIPIERTVDGSARGPKYFAWRFDPDPPGIDCPWSIIDYGSIDQGVLAADIQQADHDGLVLHADVYGFPQVIDANMSQSEQTALVNFLNGFGIPSQWLAGTMTYRAVLRTITGMMLYAQRFLAILGYPADPFTGLSLGTQFKNLPAAYQAAAQQAAADLGYPWNVTNNTTVRVMLKGMADAWGARPILMGVTSL